MKRTTRRYITLLMAVMLFLMGNGTTLAHCQHTGRTWFYGFVDDACETEDDCCDDEATEGEECVDTIHLSITSTAASDASDGIIHIPVFSLLPAIQPVMPQYVEPVLKSHVEGAITTCGPPRSVLYRNCILRL